MMRESHAMLIVKGLNEATKRCEENILDRVTRPLSFRVFYELVPSAYHENGTDGLLIQKVIFNDPATIVIWSDGDKTISKVMDGDKFDPEIGLSSAIAKKFFGSRTQFKKFVHTNYEEPTEDE